MKNNVSFYRKQRVVCGSMSEGKKVRREVRKMEEKWRKNGGECDTCDRKKSTSLLEGAHASA